MQAKIAGNQIPETMRAAVLFGPNDLRVVDWPVPKPGPGEVLVKVEACAICGTDPKLVAHPMVAQPPFGEFVPGHEWSGTVVALGPTVDELKVGDRVAAQTHRGCMRCENCIKGDYTVCLNYGNPTKGHRAAGFTMPGGYAEYTVHHHSAVYPLPEGVSFDEATMVTAAGTPLYGLDVCGAFVAGESVAVIGPGPIGLATTAVCRALCADKVILIGDNEARMRLGEQFGADHLVRERGGQRAIEQVKALTGGLGVDLAIDAAGGPSCPDDAIKMTKRGGRVLLLPFYMEPLTVDLGLAVRNDVTLFTSRGEGRSSCRRGLSMMRQGKLPLGKMITHRFPLEEIAEAFATFIQRKGDAIKVVVKP
jgi:threonine dehydrogenase-like Zn-dependent dehydrogenase